MAPPSSDDRTPRGFRIGIVCVVLAVVFYRASETIADPDLWGHIRFGQDVLRERAIPTTDRYSYLTEGYPYREWEWLSKAAIAWVYDRGGPPGLILVKTLLTLAALAWIYRRLCAQGLDALRAGMIVLVVLFVLLPGISTVRVHLFTYACFFLFLLVLDAADRGRPGWLVLLPPLCALWANLHPGVLAGLAVLVVWCAAHLAMELARTRRLASLLRPPSLWLWLTVLACVLATLVNPFGVHLLVLMAVNVPAPRPEITEFQPIRIASVEGLAYLLLLTTCVAGLLYTRRKRSPALVVVFACMALAPLLAVRHAPLFALAAAVLAGEHLADAWTRWRPIGAAGAARDPLAGRGWILPVACLAAVAVLLGLGGLHCRCLRFDPQQPFPARAVKVLQDSGAKGRMAVFFDWGDYVLWYLSPQVLVSVDGRRESTYSEEVYAENMRFTYGTGDWDELIDRHPTDLVLIGKTFPVYNLMKQKRGWLVVYEDGLCAVFTPDKSPLGQALRKARIPEDVPPTGAGLCFPYAGPPERNQQSP